MSEEALHPHVLVLDDDARVCEAVCMALNDAGFAARGVTEIEAALSTIAEAAPSAVVTDLQMPGSVDASVVGLLRRRFPKLPIIAMSGNHDLRRAALKLGASAFLPKPLRLRAVADSVAVLARAPAS